MNKQLVIIGITLLLLGVGLSGCNEKSPDSENEETNYDESWNRNDGFRLLTGEEKIITLEPNCKIDWTTQGNGSIKLDAKIISADNEIIGEFGDYANGEYLPTITQRGNYTLKLYSEGNWWFDIWFRLE
jgi:hypothetical protein